MMQQNRPAGIPCPNCQAFISMSIEELVGAGSSLART